MKSHSIAGAFAALSVACLCSSSFGEAGPRPNMIIILADDLGYGDLGCYGQKLIRTPNLDKMAQEGVRFTNFCVASSLCTPSRAALLTGCYAQRVGMGVCMREKDGKQVPWHVLHADSNQGLNPDEITIAEQLAKQGYATAIIGKWHLGDKPEFHPMKQGFQYYYGIPYSNDMKPTVMMRGTEVIEQETRQDTILSRYTEEATRYIREHKDKPFFLYMAHNAPHTPLHANEAFRGRSPRGLYGDVVEELDWSVGEMFRALKESGIDEKTLVVFFSDNGPWLMRGENGGIATPLRNGKGSTFEGGFRVPFIARWPGQIPAGKVCEEIASAMDLYPTFSHLAGTDVPNDRIIDGKDILSLLKREPEARTPHDKLLYFYMDNLQAVRKGPWKLKLATTVERDSIYTHFGDPQTSVPEALYNLEQDPGEQKSVIKDHPKALAELRALADDARKDLGDSQTSVQGTGRRPAGFLNRK